MIPLALFLAAPYLHGQVTNNKAKQVILPSLEVNEAPLQDVLNFLQLRTAELRKIPRPDPVPQTRIVKEMSFTNSQESRVGDTHITFHAESIAVWDALLYILTPIGLELAVDDAGIITDYRRSKTSVKVGSEKPDSGKPAAATS